jgi:hypothetical protein
MEVSERPASSPGRFTSGANPWCALDMRLCALFLITKLIRVTENIAVPENETVPNSVAQIQNILPHELRHSEMLLQSHDYCGHVVNTKPK